MNKNINDMTIEEIEEELNRRKEYMNNVDRPYKEGFLKHDLYGFNTQYAGQPTTYDLTCYNDVDIYSMTKEEVDGVIENFKAHIIPYMKKGTRFVCYDTDGENFWYDDVDYGLQALDDIWAAKHLENIRELENE